MTPPHKRSAWLRGYAILWLLLVAGAVVYFIYRATQGAHVPTEIADALPLLMFLALGPALFCGYPVAFILGGVALAGGLAGIALDAFQPQQFFNIPSRIFGAVAANSVLVAIPMFIFMGVMLEKSGVAKDMLFCLQVLLRRAPGGLALSVVILGTIMAATTGIVGASVIMLTLIALPSMLERGYDKSLATGVIAASGTLGILIPPSIMLVLMADLLAVPVGSLFIGAVFPGLLLTALYFIYVLGVGFLKPAAAPPLPRDIGPANARAYALMLWKGFWPPVFLIGLVLGSILFGFATPTEAAGVGAFGAIILAFVNRTFNKRLLLNTLEETALTNAMLFAIFIGATAFSYVFRTLGGDQMVVAGFEHLGLGPRGFLVASMALIFILGFFFEWIEITLIVLPIFAPIFDLLDFGTHVPKAEVLLWFAILVAVNLQTSYLTPPFGITLFYMKAIVPPSVRMQDIIKGIVPFVVLQIIGLILVIAFPEIALWFPRLLLE
ncbi:MAG: TRAP transporter large permease subunit [Burkholderiaceae bacterium]